MFRGENGPGGWAFREAEGNPNRTEYMWLFDVDLKVKTEICFTFFFCAGKDSFFMVSNATLVSGFFFWGGGGAGLVGNAGKQTLVTGQLGVANSFQIDLLV